MIYSVQYLRFIAAFVVLLFHSLEAVGVEFRQGQFGVDVFFVISGFVIYLASSSQTNSGIFFLRRFVRVALPYYVILLVLIADVVFFDFNSYFFGELSAKEALFAFMFLFLGSEGEAFTLPIYRIGWTLNFEIFFYLLFSVAILLSHRNRLLISSAFIIGLCAVQWVFRFDGGTWYMIQTRTLIEFVYGMAIAAVYLRFANETALAKRMMPLGAGLLLAGLFLLTIGPEVSPYSGNRFIYAGIPAGLLLAGVIIFEMSGRVPRSSILFYLGGASYSIYIVHYAVVKSIRGLTLDADPGERIFILLGMMGLSLTLALAFHHVIERPLHQLSRSIRTLPWQRTRKVGVPQ